MTRRQTFTYYTDCGFYKGWGYLYKASFVELDSWLKSGNYIFINRDVYAKKDLAELRSRLASERKQR